MKIAIIGAGVIGNSVALDLACNGYDVVLKDISESILLKSKQQIEKDFKMVRLMKLELTKINIKEIFSRIVFTTSYSNFENAEFIIENITEDWKQKEKVYNELNRICNENAIFCTNTSCISITKIASLLDHPENVIGTHFMNPVPLKGMVEVIRGFKTSESTINRVSLFLKKIKKTPIIVNDYPGFVSNRISHLFMNEAAFVVQDQIAQPKDVDNIFKKGFAHAMGPLETADLIGIDTVVNSLKVLYGEYQDSKFRCCPLLKKMVNAGKLGRKTGEGFYKY